MTRGVDLDDPKLTLLRRDLMRTKPALQLTNDDWYARLERIDGTTPPGVRVEIGTGGGCMETRIPGLVKTDVQPLPFVSCVCRAEELPFARNSVAAIYMINVLHHVLEPRRFLADAAQVLKPGGICALIEPQVTPFSRIIYRYFHPEPFEPEAERWELPPSGPLSGGNDALPWIIFVRDRPAFEREFPDLTIEHIESHTSITRLFSGGVMMRSLLPDRLYPPLLALEGRMPAPVRDRLALFMTVVLRKAGDGHSRPHAARG